MKPGSIASTTPYGCSNKPRPIPNRRYTVQAGWDVGGDGLMRAPTTFVRHTMSTECRYDAAKTDPRCGECRHKGE